ncbi:hypothetical protein HDV06_003157 [Boothiomyces sp. JEL0866]|nr:hypothetical protein HDV06_003157 [Boothiomyces sp. JEL0866]
MQKYEAGNNEIEIDESSSETIHQSLKDYANNLVPPRNVQLSTTIKVTDYPPFLNEVTIDHCSSACISINGNSTTFEEGKRYRFFQLLPKGKLGSNNKSLKSISSTRHIQMPLSYSIDKLYQPRCLDKCNDLPMKKPREDVDLILMVKDIKVKKENQSPTGLKFQIEMTGCDETGESILQGQVSQKRLDYLKKSKFFLFKDLEYLYFKENHFLNIVGHTVISSSLIAPYKSTNGIEILRNHFA